MACNVSVGVFNVDGSILFILALIRHCQSYKLREYLTKMAAPSQKPVNFPDMINKIQSKLEVL